MLEVHGLTKVYKSKKGADVHALDGVTLQFPKTGMVFLLGKSGSGKSTLLNVCGGLDAPTTGEIIVKGRSSKEFSQSDFDSYRNTYVGFIFQEYNILNEFSVEDNIALALELQGKPKDKKAVAELLAQVDLEGYAKRKPNTLSGGQKQRIAIARALVKSPEIIMADEPTGALDSVTGKQVFETLKKLSKDKLVIVVSHDHEFAEQYGDRIIELKDGKVLSDVSKTQEEQKAISDNISTYGDVLCIKHGAELVESDFEAIKAFLKQSNGDIVIANGEKDVKNFKKISRITEQGEKEVFRDTDESEIERKTYTPEESKFIRSKLPARHAFRIGVSSLKTKPVRLFFTILLCSIAFVLFGLLSTMSFYDSESTFKQTMRDTEHALLKLGKNYEAKETMYHKGEQEYEYDTYFEGSFSQAEIDNLKSVYGEHVFGGIDVSLEYNIRSSVAPYWMSQINSIAYLPEGNVLREQITGTYPANKEELCISSYMADVMMNCGIYDGNGNAMNVSTREELIGKTLNISGTTFTITGIMDSGVISEKFEPLKSAETDNNQLVFEMSSALRDGLSMIAFVSQDRLELMATQYKPYQGEELHWYREIAMSMYDSEKGETYPDYSNLSYREIKDYPFGSKEVYFNGEQETLEDGQTLVSARSFYEFIASQYNEKINKAQENEDFEAADKLSSRQTLCYDLMNGGIWKTNSETKKDELIRFTDEEMYQKTMQLYSLAKSDKLNLTIKVKLFNPQAQAVYGDEHTFTVVGVVNHDENERQCIFISKEKVNSLWKEQRVNVDYYSEISTKYVEEEGSIFTSMYLPFDKSEEQINLFWDLYKNEEYDDNASRIRPNNVFVNQLENVDTLVKSLSKIFLYVGLVLAVFAALLLSNFISVSISQKKKEIGILRAVGARSLDVFKIFFSESFVITTVCVVLASVGTTIICNILNKNLASEIGASLFVFGIASFVILVLIAIVTTIVATFLPVWNAAKKKPVESIRAL